MLLDTKEVDNNLNTLANLSKYSTQVKYILNGKDLSKKLTDIYSKNNSPMEQRRDLSIIYSNYCKNTYILLIYKIWAYLFNKI